MGAPVTKLGPLLFVRLCREAKREATKSAVLEVLGASVSKLGFEDPEGTMSKKLQHQYAVAKHRLKKATKEFQVRHPARHVQPEIRQPVICGGSKGRDARREAHICPA